jgi:hypothetical protein
MSQAILQSELFAAEDWQVIYQAFTQVNFNAYDFNSIRTAMVQYIQQNYPEDFNDWVESAELVAIIDLLAYLGESLAYRMDLNTRENFLTSAERRQSILRLAYLVSYNASRNLPARGTLKLVGVQTNNNVFDSNGANLNGVTINWNDASNPDWYEQFVDVLNDAFLTTNPFGIPVSSGTVGGILTQLYEFNSIPINAGSFDFTATVDGLSLNFEAVNSNFENMGTFTEFPPDPSAAYHLLYQNDGNGFASANTGFFVYFKQGTLQFSDFNITVPVQNRDLSIAVNNINDIDVWVDTIDSGGFNVQAWTEVQSTFGNNVIFNELANNIRYIFSVITQDNDQILVRFGDGRFGNIPTGLIRVWYRVSANQAITVRPQDLQGVQITVPYYNLNGQSQNLTMTFSLQTTITNATTSETDSSIAQNAPQLYYTQDRMVNGQDYNVFPLSNSEALKVKAINRFYSGQSRYIDINDPTALYNNSNVFSDDGILWLNNDTVQNTVPINANFDADQVMLNVVQPNLESVETYQFLLQALLAAAEQMPPAIFVPPTVDQIIWVKSTNANYSSTGYFATVLTPTTPVLIGVNSPAIDVEDIMTEGALIKFQNAGWVSIATIANNGTQTNGQGTVTLSDVVNTGDIVIKVVPAINTTLTTTEYNNIKALLNVLNPQQFAIYYDWRTQSWGTYLYAGAFDTSPAHFTFYNPALAPVGQNTGWVMYFQYQNSGVTQWFSQTRGLQYIYESVQNVRFFFINSYKSVNIQTGLANQDTINIFGTNSQPVGNPTDSWAQGTISTYPLGENILFALVNNFTYPEGYIEPRRVEVTFYSSQDNGIPDNPESFTQIVAPGTITFWESYYDQYGYRYYEPALGVKIRRDLTVLDQPIHLQVGDVVYVQSTSLFYNVITLSSITTSADLETITDPTQYILKPGRPLLNFQWKHYATTDQRIDPAISNLIDIYVLTSGYDTLIRQWVSTGAPLSQLPQPETGLQLANDFANIAPYAMFSDQLIWHPVSYMLLFGTRAPVELQAQFVVVPVAGTQLSNQQIQSQVIQAVDNYFAVQNWDFGQTFYFTELAAYIHIQLAPNVASVTLVPLAANQAFGDLFQIQVPPNQIPISAATVNDVIIVQTLTEQVLRVS